MLCIDSPASTSVMFCSLPDSMAQFAINNPSSHLEALPDGAGAICLADASWRRDCQQMFVSALFLCPLDACAGICACFAISEKSVCIQHIWLGVSLNTSTPTHINASFGPHDFVFFSVCVCIYA